MNLVDTSIWVDHFRAGDAGLVALLERGLVLGHPFVIGELALGGLRRRDEVLTYLADLPAALVASDDEVLGLIRRHELFGIGIGYVDAHLLAATMLTPDASLWTRDRRLGEAARRLGVGCGVSWRGGVDGGSPVVSRSVIAETK